MSLHSAAAEAHRLRCSRLNAIEHLGFGCQYKATRMYNYSNWWHFRHRQNHRTATTASTGWCLSVFSLRPTEHVERNASCYRY